MFQTLVHRLRRSGLGFEIVESVGLSHGLIGFIEMYWTGFLQSIFKSNANNIDENDSSRIALRPSNKVPWVVFITDLIISMDLLFKSGNKAIGRGMVLRKK